MKLTIKEIAVFGMLGAVMYASKLLMELLPNVHLLGVFVVAFTVVYRKKALYPIYTYVILNGVFCGFAAWWVPYLYMDDSLGCRHAPSKENAKKNSAYRVHDGMRGTWFFIRNIVRPGACNPLWTEF